MMGLIDLRTWDRESGSARPPAWTGDSAPPLAERALLSPSTAMPTGGGYMPHRRRGSVLAAILALHVGAVAALASTRFEAGERDQPQRLATFTIQEPPTPPPLEPLPAEPAVQPVSAPLVAPAAAIEVPRRLEIPAVPPEAVRPVLTPAALVVSDIALPAPPRPAPPAPAPMTPPDFTAAQLRNPGPAYPYLSRRGKEEGVVLLKVLVGIDGRAARLEIEESSGFDRLDEAALKTVGKWRFVPASQAGQPREAWVLVPVTFALG